MLVEFGTRARPLDLGDAPGAHVSSGDWIEELRQCIKAPSCSRRTGVEEVAAVVAHTTMLRLAVLESGVTRVLSVSPTYVWVRLRVHQVRRDPVS